MRSHEVPRRTSLRARVAVATAVVAAVVGLVAAGVAFLVVERLELAAQDQRLVDAAEIMERLVKARPDQATHIADVEAAEVAAVGLHLALFEEGRWRGGADDVLPPLEDGCTTRINAAGRWRTCALGPPSRRVVVSALSASQRSQGLAYAAVLATAIIAALVSALVSRALAGWALAPLTALGERLERIPEDAPADADLGAAGTTSEVEALRDTIRALLGRLGAAVDRSHRFAASAAHELRTPLATMMAELDLAAEDSPQVAESLARVRRTVGRLSVLVERLLMGATGSAAALVTEAVAMEDVVREVIASRPEAERARLVPTIEASGMVRGDEALLRIIVDNLVDNALKFARTGPIDILVAESSGEVHVVVRDEGPGIDPSDANRLLLPFTRGRPVGAAAVPGHGLGLSIVAHAVRLHGGEVRFASPREGRRGAELLVTLPAWSGSSIP
ncbi:MAG: putative two component system response sensor kinase rane-associated protein PhoR [Labilithrix sp.]|nr:putative two component system response sensor kinase rane-associated protein PhoR [Labilithrix sp.]